MTVNRGTLRFQEGKTMTAPIRVFLAHNLWANLRLLDACASLEDVALDALLPGTYGNIRASWLHLSQGEEGYVFRFTSERPTNSLRGVTGFPGFDVLRAHLQQSGEGLMAIAENIDADRVIQIEYDERLHNIPATLILLQAINHGTDHRSQIATLLSQHGITPPEVDGWAYFEQVIEPAQSS
jgi:uncharacterized damage-inducible protein DinB